MRRNPMTEKPKPITIPSQPETWREREKAITPPRTPPPPPPEKTLPPDKK